MIRRNKPINASSADLDPATYLEGTSLLIAALGLISFGLFYSFLPRIISPIADQSSSFLIATFLMKMSALLKKLGVVCLAAFEGTAIMIYVYRKFKY